MHRLRRILGGIKHHAYSIGGQVAAAAPAILIAAILARTSGIAAAGYFVVIAAYASVLFTALYFGFIYYVSIDRFKVFSVWDFTITRFFSAVIASAILFISAQFLNIPNDIALLVIALRFADSASDLVWGFELFLRQGNLAVKNYAFLNLTKIVAILLPLLSIFFVEKYTAVEALIIGAVFACLLCWGRLFLVSMEGGHPTNFIGQLSRSLSLVRYAIWYALGGIVSALVANSPRLVLEGVVSGEMLGVIAVTLSSATLYGMAFMSVWLHWFPRLSKERAAQRRFHYFMTQSILLAILLIILSINVVPYILSRIFDFNLAVYQVVCSEVLIAMVIFNLAMNVTNLFKLTPYVYLESVALIFGVAIGLIFLQWGGVIEYVISAGIFIIIFCAITFFFLKNRYQSSQKVIFLRFTSRPVSRVVRMMTIAREAGCDVLFIGAYRDSALPHEDCWEGLPVRRLGPHFPLLNGKGFLKYIYCVLACNVCFFIELCREAPAVVHASDVETMPSAVAYRLLTGRRIVFNIHDNLAQRYALSSVINNILNWIEGFAVLCANKTLVPETFRRDALPPWCRYKISVIRNLPLKEMSPAPPVPIENGRIRVFYGGWLDWQRGLSALLTLAKEPDIDVRIAGEGSSEIIKEICASEATYLGFLPSEDIFKETMACHFVPVLYDPSRKINRYSASNKLAETLSLGRPLIINQEMEVARDLGEGLALIKVEYAKAALVSPTLRKLISDVNAYAAACSNARSIYQGAYDKDLMRIQSLNALFGDERLR